MLVFAYLDVRSMECDLKFIGKVLLILFLGITPLGCDDVGDALFDCIDFDRPELTESDPPTGIINEEYFAIIRARIENEPNDDSYIYDFYIEGDLPEGLAFRIDAENRQVIVEGIPLESGIFNFEVEVEVSEENPPAPDPFGEEPAGDDDDLCGSSDLERYSLEIVS